MKKIRILLADDHKIIRDGIISLLKNSDDIEVVQEADNGEEALGYIQCDQYDLVLMDIDMPKMNGIEATQLILKENPKTKILALSMHDEETYIGRMLRAGASGYVLKNTSKDELIKAIHDIAQGIPYFSQAVSNKMMKQFMAGGNGEEESDSEVTKREKEIIQLISNGLTNKEMARELSLSVRTIDAHRRNLLKKLNAKNALEMIKVARERGYL